MPLRGTHTIARLKHAGLSEALAGAHPTPANSHTPAWTSAALQADLTHINILAELHCDAGQWEPVLNLVGGWAGLGRGGLLVECAEQQRSCVSGGTCRWRLLARFGAAPLSSCRWHACTAGPPVLPCQP